ncbi:MAG: hypothetical protein AcusKO_11520 [Acuticoccus sp.]
MKNAERDGRRNLDTSGVPASAACAVLPEGAVSAMPTPSPKPRKRRSGHAGPHDTPLNDLINQHFKNV